MTADDDPHAEEARAIAAELKAVEDRLRWLEKNAKGRTQRLAQSAVNALIVARLTLSNL